MSDGEKLAGQAYDIRSGRHYAFVQQMLDVNGAVGAVKVSGAEGTPGADLTPHDYNAQLSRQYNLDAIIEMLEAEVLIYATRGNIPELPKVLTEITSTYNDSSGDGGSNYPVTQQEFLFSGGGSGNLSPKASAEASAALIPDVRWKLRDYSNWIVDQTIYVFNLVQTTVTKADIIARLNAIVSPATVNAMPIFKTEQVQLTLKGRQVSIQQTATSTASISSTGSSEAGTREWGDSFSTQVGGSIRTETIQESLHAEITIADATASVDIQVEVVADTTELVATGITVDPITNEPDPLEATATASIEPSVISATTPTDIPKTGLYLISYVAQQDDFGSTQVRAIVVDMSQYA